MCSKSGVTSPIDYVLQEGATCVHDLVNGVQSTKLRGLVMKHHEILKHAMSFRFVHYIVYSTCSVYNCENEDVIKKVIEENNSETGTKSSGNPFSVTSFLPDLTDKLRVFKATGLDVVNSPSGTGKSGIFHLYMPCLAREILSLLMREMLKISTMSLTETISSGSNIL